MFTDVDDNVGYISLRGTKIAFFEAEDNVFFQSVLTYLMLPENLVNVYFFYEQQNKSKDMVNKQITVNF